MNVPSLTSWLESLSHSDQSTLAMTHQIDAQHIYSGLKEAHVWVRYIERLPRPTQAVVARIRRAGGVMSGTVLESIAGPLRTNLDTISPRTYLTIHHPLTPLEQLFVGGVVWPMKTASGARQWVVPPDIEQSLGAIPPLIVSGEVHTPQGGMLVPNIDEILLVAACLAVDGRLSLANHGRVSHVMLQRLGRSDVTMVMFQWMMSCWLAAGVFRVDTRGLTPTQRLLEWLMMSPHERQQEMMRAWLQAAWNEWEMSGAKKRPPALDIRYARRTLVHAFLAHLPESWCDWCDVVDQIRLAWPDMVRATNQQGKWNPPIGWLTTWPQEDGQLIEYMLRGPAQWLGLVEWDEQGSYIRRTDLGGWIAGINMPPTMPVPAPALLEDDLSIVVPDSANYYARFQLHRIADWRDSVTAQITPSRVRQAIASGMSSTTYLEIVQSVLARPIPAAQETLIRAWAHDVAQVVVQNMVLILTTSAEAMHDIMHDRQVALPKHHVLNATTFAVAPHDAAGVVRRLRRAGYAVDVQAFKSTQFDDAELAILDRVVRSAAENDTTLRSLHTKIMRLRKQGDTNG